MNQPLTNTSQPGNQPAVSIYVVDDEPMLLELTRVVLERLGYRVQTFRTAEGAFEAFGATPTPPSLIITDYALQSMTGLELIEACRRTNPAQKAILVSGTVDERVYLNCRAAARPNGFLTKPYQARELIDLIAWVIKEQG
jgi:CheY-like chemotaxis protein